MAFGRWRWLGLAVALALAGAGLWLAAGRGVSAPGPRILFTELRGDRSLLWLATARDPQERTQVVEIPHRDGYGIGGRLSPDGRRLAYTLVPPEAHDPATESLLQILDLETGHSQELARGVDAWSTPVWSAQGDWILFRRLEHHPDLQLQANGGDIASLWRVRVTNGEEQELTRDEVALGLRVVGWLGNTVYYIHFNMAGSDLMALEVSGALRQAQDTALRQAQGAVQRLAHLSDGVARDFQLSPNGSRIVYTTPSQTGVYSLNIFDLSSGKTTTLVSEAIGYFSPVWRLSDQEVTYGSVAPAAGLRTQTVDGGVTTALPRPNDGFDLPLSWSSDGAYLAVRYLKGTPLQVISERLAILAEDGSERWVMETQGYAEFLGWREG